MCTTGCQQKKRLLKAVSIPCKRESTCAPGGVDDMRRSGCIAVSIPCKRESTCARMPPNFSSRTSTKFPFPANGKAHVHYSQTPIPPHHDEKFPFPANGKAHVHNYIVISCFYHRHRVSIPCKRESTCAQRITRLLPGRRKFPFPANGKAHVHEK